MGKLGYNKQELEEVVAISYSKTEVLKKLGMRPSGGGSAVLRKYLEKWEIDTSHFDPYHSQRKNIGRSKAKCLEEILVENSTYPRSHLKARLLDLGIKTPECEICGQGEMWQGKKMSLHLDHINGVRNDNRIDNLRIICPNCDATLETYGGKNRKKSKKAHRDMHWRRAPRPHKRKVERPSFEQLQQDVRELGYLGTGRKYGVSDNAIRKWLKTQLR